MNKYLLLLFFLPFVLCGCHTKDDCASVHNGHFYYTLFSGKEKIRVIRTDSLQVETNGKGIQLGTRIRWTGPCSFDMFMKPSPTIMQVFNDTAMGDLPVHVEIVKVTKDYYISEARASYKGKSFEKRDTLFIMKE